ncbi:glycoprotein 3-alpha-L-fucosyltransferase A-like [Diadema antillarum]|uniref:glycoprotein 3-alpha-L-fucosyltransferase A-like n=1 Tax=Diadema antillarum TaxID=105358 RepID=UPI003A863553
MTNSAPFEKGGCFRQVHLWADEPLTPSGSPGDFLCPGLPCGLRLVVNTDMESLRSSDAVILYHLTAWDWAELHRQRPPGQKWIFYTHESPRNTPNHVLPPMEYRNNSYDFLMTYTTEESHLYGSFGWYNPDVPQLRSTEMKNWSQNKTKQVAWMASNCDSVSWDRKGFVQALSKYIPVSTYGKCGDLPCPKDERCNLELRTHKFYLALENSECRDYLTEKFWKNALHNDIVPVVYGPPREDYEKVFPPEAFIHVQDFKSVKELAEYLIKLDEDDNLYNKFFEWKKSGSIQVTEEEWLLEPEQICSTVVSRLLADEKDMRGGTYSPPKFPEDWVQWWNGSCTSDGSQYPIEI